jgi:hypothetical protein
LLDDSLLCVQNEDIKVCKQPYTLLSPHTCDASVEQQTRSNANENMQAQMMLLNNHQSEQSNVAGASGVDKQRDEDGINEPN